MNYSTCNLRPVIMPPVKQIDPDDVNMIVGTTLMLACIIILLIKTFSTRPTYEHYYSYT